MYYNSLYNGDCALIIPTNFTYPPPLLQPLHVTIKVKVFSECLCLGLPAHLKRPHPTLHIPLSLWLLRPVLQKQSLMRHGRCIRREQCICPSPLTFELNVEFGLV